MDKTLSQLIRISNTVGEDSSLVQGGGGNTSVKSANGKYMYIKASGTVLKDMTKQDGWRRLRLDAVRSIIKDKSIAQLDTHTRETEVVNQLLLACDNDVTSGARGSPNAKKGRLGVPRPSVEAHLHAFLDKCVIHLHPSAVGAYVNAKNGKTELEKLFKGEGIPESLPPLWVPYTDPGFMLAKRIARAVAHYQNQFSKKPVILFLEKHGLIVSAKSADTALQLVRKVINRCSSKLKQLKTKSVKRKAKRVKPDTQYLLPRLATRVAEASAIRNTIYEIKLCIRKAFFEATGQYTTISYFYDDCFAAFWRRKDAQKLLSSGVLTPDELVYANGSAMWVPLRLLAEDKSGGKKIAGRLSRQINKAGKPSVAFLVKGVGLFVAASEKVAPTVRDIVASSLFIRTNAYRMGGICSLNKRQQDFINRWEAEAFRMKLASGSGKGEL